MSQDYVTKHLVHGRMAVRLLVGLSMLLCHVNCTGSTDFFVFAVHLLGFSSIMGAINIIATIMNMRAPGMTLMNMPMFVWTWLITAFLLIAVMPVLAGAVTMMLTDK